jgi:hypothetical protein
MMVYIGSDRRTLRAAFFTFFTARFVTFLARPTVDVLALLATTLLRCERGHWSLSY